MFRGMLEFLVSHVLIEVVTGGGGGSLMVIIKVLITSFQRRSSLKGFRRKAAI
jgi:hypothetical protein